MDSRELAAAQELLMRALSAKSATEFAQALRIHGPVLAPEVPLLAERAESPDETVRRNATRLLRTTTKGDAPAVLRKLVDRTADPVVFVIAADGLRGESDSRALCASKPALLMTALADSEPRNLTAALRVAACAQAPGLYDVLPKLLRNPDQDVRYAAVDALEKVGVGPLEPTLKELLRDRSARLSYPFATLYGLLVNSDDPELAAAFKSSLEGATGAQAADFINAVASSRKPWIRQLLLELSRTDGVTRWPAFVTLSAWGPPVERELLAICIEALEKTPPKSDEQKRWMYLIDLETCRKYLGQLAGRAPYKPEEAEDALAFARKRLAQQ